MQASLHPSFPFWILGCEGMSFSMCTILQEVTWETTRGDFNRCRWGARGKELPWLH